MQSKLQQAMGHHIVILIIGAFFVAKAIETNQLHKRIALFTIRIIGTSRKRVMLGFMIATGFLSMWTSNNSTTLMMLPIGLAIASSFQISELISWIRENINIDGVPIFIIVVLVVFLMVFLTEINLNTANTAVFLPVLAGLSKGASIHPFLLMVLATIAASCAFMLSSETGPNASVLASGKLSIPQMAKVGLGLNILAVAFITILVYLIMLPVFGISDSLPLWIKQRYSFQVLRYIKNINLILAC